MTIFTKKIWLIDRNSNKAFIITLSEIFRANLLQKIRKKKLSSPVICTFLSLAGLCLNSGPAGAMTLKNLLLDALRTHPSIVSEIHAVESANSNVESAEWAYYPTPTFSANAPMADNSDADEEFGVNIGLEQPLWTGGEIEAEADRAHLNYQISKAKLKKIQRDIALSVVSHYSDWMRFYEAEQAWQKGADIYAEMIGKISNRHKVGVASKADLFLAKDRLSSALANLASVSSSKQEALYRLSELVGYAVSSDNIIQQHSKLTIEQNVDLLLEQVESYSPDIEIAMANVQLAHALKRKQEAASSLKVSLALEGDHSWGGARGSKSEGRVFIKIRSALGAGLSTWSKQKSAEAEVKMSVNRVKAIRRSEREKILVDIALINSLENRLSNLQSSMLLSTAISESYSRQYLAGMKTWLETMNSMRESIAITISFKEAYASKIAAEWRLIINSYGINSEMMKGQFYE